MDLWSYKDEATNVVFSWMSGTCGLDIYPQ